MLNKTCLDLAAESIANAISHINDHEAVPLHQDNPRVACSDRVRELRQQLWGIHTAVKDVSHNVRRAFDPETLELTKEEKRKFVTGGVQFSDDGGYNYWLNKISTIKMYRERTGEGLREAKEAVERYQKELEKMM